MEIKENQYHIVLFPWLAFGHVIPFLELSKSLASKGDIQISFISTPSIIKRLPPIHPPSLKACINLISVDFPSVDNLPAGCEATVDLKDGEQTQYLKIAYDLLQVPVETLLDQIKPDLIVFDIINCWVPDIGAKLGISTAYFSVFYAPFLAFVGPPSEYKEPNKCRTPEDLTSVPEWIPFPSSVACRYHEAIGMNEVMNTKDATGLSTGDRHVKVVEGCDFILLKSITELDGDYVNLLKDIFQKPVLSIGLLPPPAPGSSVRSNSGDSSKNFNSEMFDWLDEQQPKTVVYVSFGSEYKMSIDEIHELAFGLETSRLPFLWVLWKPEGIDQSNLLPSGFEDRIRGRGFMCFGWIYQILMPMIIDQGINARFLADKGLGFEVERKEDGSFTRDAVAKAMRIQVGAIGERLVSKTKKLGRGWSAF
ncbi:UDP-glycosyltransferase 91C1-like [Papaver somniferum]|uniref:UDP-glycosyltransferase 91C1-like n=1 Tax=Papaver somniferum TaxID=3469 RepID=UPI000E700C87|nr:UDP-glycosyltransferase 91C1-like [Papaver somniferum]